MADSTEQTNAELKETLRTQWRELSDSWIDQVGDGREVHRVGLLDEWMLNAVGDVSDLQVIDLGCGEGRFSRMLSERGAKVMGVDLCEPFVQRAESLRIADEEYVVGDMEDLRPIEDDVYDLAVSYITLVDVPNFAKAASEAHRVLKPGGRFVACNLQPMATAGNGWIKHWDQKLFFKLDDYFDESTRTLPLWGHELTNFHRTLSHYINTFLEAGFALEGIREPKPSEQQVAEFPDIADNLRVPLFIIYLLRKRI